MTIDHKIILNEVKDYMFIALGLLLYTIAFNGKTRLEMEFPADADNKTIEEAVLADEKAKKYLEGFQIAKVIIVPKRMVNIVLKK